jgi:hypothetical protein
MKFGGVLLEEPAPVVMTDDALSKTLARATGLAQRLVGRLFGLRPARI